MKPKVQVTKVVTEKLDAGRFSSWLATMAGALRGDNGVDVPCGACTACCRSSQFVHIEPDEEDTLAHIPREVLFPAPKLPRGHVLMGYDQDGLCPMLDGDKCSIYLHRPRTCPVDDCRVFAVDNEGVEPAGKDLIARQVSRWQFRFPSKKDRIENDAARSAVRYLAVNSNELGDELEMTTPVQRTLLAIELHELFLDRHAAGGPLLATPSLEAVRAAIRNRAVRHSPSPHRSFPMMTSSIPNASRLRDSSR